MGVGVGEGAHGGPPATMPHAAAATNTHTHAGMIFQVTASLAPNISYVPKTIPISWTINSENFPDVAAYVGDTVRGGRGEGGHGEGGGRRWVRKEAMCGDTERGGGRRGGERRGEASLWPRGNNNTLTCGSGFERGALTCGSGFQWD